MLPKWCRNALFLLIVAFPSAVSADEVSLSRLVVRAHAVRLEAIDVGATDRYCGDADGCQLVLRAEGGAAAKALIVRLFVHTPVYNIWFSTESGGQYLVDSDGTAQPAVHIELGGGGCAVDDGDAFDPGLDSAAGFELIAYGPGGVDCTLTISD
jgi:hypothetical protein